VGVEEQRLRVMGSDAHIVLVDPAPDGFDQARARLLQLDERWSRFRPDSELSILNLADGAWVPVSTDTLVLVTTMQLAAFSTGGVYDPTFLYEVLETGYTASLDDPTRTSIMIDLPCPGKSVHEVSLDRARSALRLPPGLALDAGGIGKGLAADVLVAELLAAGTAGALVSIGGDLCAAGAAPNDDGWMVEIADPFRPGTPATRLVLNGGGVATSSTQARRSSNGDCWQHHTIDPATRQSSATDLASVTVIAGTGWEAEAHATAALIAGADNVVGYAALHDVSVVAIDLEGRRIRSADLAGADPSTPTEALIS
jgi:FAD:protein FMN transferase